MKKTVIYGITYLFLIFFSSCGKFLVERNLSSISNIQSLQDMQALMDATVINVGSYSSLLEMASDNFFLGKAGYDRASDLEKAVFTWSDTYSYEIREETAHWTRIYHIIAVANTVLDELPLVNSTKGLSSQHIEGTAYFHRAFAYLNLVQIYCEAYDPLKASRSPGLPLRLDSDINTPSFRSTLEDTYRLIEHDLTKAIDLLPILSQYKTRPNKASAHALLAKVYLLMENYAKALAHSKSSLALYDLLIDFNDIDSRLPVPFNNLNEETLYYATSSAGVLNPTRECYVDTILYNSYQDGDLRKEIFFKNENNGYFSFRGSYTGQVGAGIFLGLTVSENLLIKAETLARMGQVEGALESLNQLLVTRHDPSSFEPIVILDPDKLLETILNERRKELLFRGSRWSDLKRLNKDARFAKTMVRKISGYEEVWDLPSGDSRYLFLIPNEVIKKTGMEQNVR